MRNSSRAIIGLAALIVTSVALAEMQSIPADQLDPQKIYWGTASGFEKPSEVQYDELIKETPEYKELKKKKIERGTGKYWILMSQASDRVVKAISQVGQETEYDLIAAQGYLGGLKPPIAAEDITPLVLEVMNKSSNGNGKGHNSESKGK
ncbi:MAG: hypothetical protein WC655_10990 [Candidatus Hydrogenedentales bacterium]|jgi:hypothetical protein